MRPKWRWQFSLRTMLLVVSVSCAALSLWVLPAEKQRRAVAEIEAVHGRVWYAQDSLSVREAFPKKFLRRWLPRDYFDEVEQVSLSHSKATDADLAHVATLKKLRALYVDNTRVTDAGLAHLQPLKHLERLCFSRTRATLAGRAKLQRALPDCRVAGP